MQTMLLIQLILDMSGHKIVNLKEPTARSDAVTKGFVESIFSADLDMHEHKISNVADPVNAQDVITLSFSLMFIISNKVVS
jgi:hypothetical protein